MNIRMCAAGFIFGLGSALMAAETIVPSNEEVDILTMINRHRGDRVMGDYRTHEAIHAAFPQLQMAFFGLNGTEPAQPPLVLSPVLMTAARTLLAKGLTPVAMEPVDHKPILTDVGYQPAATGLILCGFDQPTPTLAYLTCFVQAVGRVPHANGAIQPIHGGLSLLAGSWRQVGVAMRTVKGQSSLVLVLGSGSAPRYLGGQVYADVNRNGLYDPGEGKMGISVSHGDDVVTTGPSGVWWMEQANDDRGEISFMIEGKSAKRQFAQGAGNASIDCRVPRSDDVVIAKRLVASTEKALKGSDKDARTSRVLLLCQTRSADLDDALRARVDVLTEPVRDDFADTVQKMRSVISLEPQEYKSEVLALQKAWNGDLSSWFKEWEKIYTIRRLVRSVLARPAEEQAKHARAILKQFPTAKNQSSDPDLRAMYRDLLESLQAFEELQPQEK